MSRACGRCDPISHGDTCHRVDLDGLVVTDTMHGAGQKLSTHRHSLANALFVLKGSFTENSAGKTQRCDQLSLLIRPAEELHSNEYDHFGTRCLIVGFDASWHAGQATATALGRLSNTRTPAVASIGLKLHRELGIGDGASALAIEGLILELLAEAVRSAAPRRSARPPRWLDLARDFLHAHFADPLTLREAARHAGVHPGHLARAFRTQYQCTIGEYVRALRIEFARRELVTSRASLAEIALAAGFAAQSHFTTVFRRHVGMTPGQYRAAVRSGDRGAEP